MASPAVAYARQNQQRFLNELKALLRIPCGKTLTYQEIAHQVGRPKASRAVGNAVGSAAPTAAAGPEVLSCSSSVSDLILKAASLLKSSSSIA